MSRILGEIRQIAFVVDDGLIFEMADLKEPSQYARVMHIAAEAKCWDGSNPVRDVLA